MGTGVLPEAKRPGREVNHSPPYSAEVKNERSYAFSPPICLYDVDSLLHKLTLWISVDLLMLVVLLAQFLSVRKSGYLTVCVFCVFVVYPIL